MAELAASIPRPTRCFCQITLHDLKVWALRKYHDRLPTMQLFAMARTVEEREAVCIVALLDLPDDEVVRLMHPLTQTHCDILACRDHVRHWLRDMLDTQPTPRGSFA